MKITIKEIAKQGRRVPAGMLAIDREVDGLRHKRLLNLPSRMPHTRTIVGLGKLWRTIKGFTKLIPHPSSHPSPPVPDV